MVCQCFHQICPAILLAGITGIGLTAFADAGDTGTTTRLTLTADDGSEVARCLRDSGHSDEFVETRYSDDALLPALRREEEERGYLIFHRHWMDLVFPNSIPKRSEITDRLRTFGSPGEDEPLTFCVRTLRDLRGVKVRVSGLMSENGNRIAAPDAHIVRCAPRTWQGEEWLYEDGPVGMMNMPVYLERARLLDAAPDLTVQYWLTVKINEDAAPGIYYGRIDITEAAGSTEGIDVTLEVLPIKLREPRHTLGFWDFQRPYHGEIGTRNEVYRVMSEYGMNAVFARAGLFEYDQGSDRYDFSRYIAIDASGHVSVSLDDSDLERCLEAARSAGLRHVIYSPTLFMLVMKEIPDRYDRRVLVQQTNEELASVIRRFEGSPHFEVIKNEITRAGEDHFPIYSQAYADLYVEIVRKTFAEVKRRDWPTLVFSSLDEAVGHHLRSRTAFPFLLRHLELSRRAGAMTLVNHCSPFMNDEFGEYVRAAMMHLDIAMPGGRLSGDPERTSAYNATLDQLVEAFATENVTTFNYSLSGQAGGAFPDPCVARFTGGFFFHTLGVGVRGNMDYIYFRPEGNPYNPVDDFNTHDSSRLWSHERLWYFPPDQQSGRLGGPSLSLAAKREGIDDLRYLETLDLLIEQAQTRVDTSDAVSAADKAKTVKQQILKSLRFTDEALDSNARNLWSRWETVTGTRSQTPAVGGRFRLEIGWEYSTYDRHRRAIAEEIMNLNTVLSKN